MAWAAVLAGLAGLVAGFRLLSGGLRGAAGGWLAAAVRQAAAGRVRGLAAGAAVTALVQSSSLTTIFFVGCVDAGLLTVEQAVPLLMGANIGTTVTAHLLAGLAGGGGLPLQPWLGCGLALAGLAWRGRAGGVLLGAGAVALSLEALGRGLAPLASAPWFAGLLAAVGERPLLGVAAVGERPLLGVAAGAGLTALVMSSSVTISLLQQMVAAGLVPLPAALAMLCGDNIGTTADTLLAGLAGGRRARAAAYVHVLFDLVGTALLLPLAPAAAGWLAAAAASPARQVALAHTGFNVLTALFLLPATGRLARLGRRLAGA